jgi:hypothetical protein
MNAERPGASSKKMSGPFRWFALILFGCVALYAGSFAVGLMTPGWDIFRLSPQSNTYGPPPGPAADKSVADASARAARIASASALKRSPQDAARGPQQDATSSDSDTTDLTNISPPGSVERDAGSSGPKDTSRDVSQKDSGQDTSQDSSEVWDSPPTIAALAPDARAINPSQDAASSRNGTAAPNRASQDSDAPTTTSGLAPLSTSKTASRSADVNSPRGTAAKPSNAATNLAGSSRPIKTTQNMPPASPDMTPAPKRRAPSEFSQKMWYK